MPRSETAFTWAPKSRATLASHSQVSITTTAESDPHVLLYEPKRLIFGDEDFVKAHAPTEPPPRPVARAAFDQARPTLAELVDRHLPDEVIRRARLEYRYTLGEIAAAIGCSAETVRRRLKMWDVGT